MDKRYQVFVSSTFTDLEEERKHVIQTLMEMDCIPAGMELFPAIDETQWEFIKKIIDDCDYYLLIIGGRYGSTADDGLSYTEKEFDYAVSKGLKVTVLIHEDPDSLPMKKTELNPESREKLSLFIDKAQKGRLRKTWRSVQELPGLVALSMTKTIKTYPATGWVRADKISNESDLRDLIELQKEVEELRKRIADSSPESDLSYTGQIADFDSEFDLNYKIRPTFSEWGGSTDCKLSWSWRQFFHFISPYVFKGIKHDELFNSIRIKLNDDATTDNYVTLNESDLQTIELQFIALGLITFDNEKWTLTNKGKMMMMEVRTIK
ncbi:DUF4062 domain-containing protein [Pectobacterium aroidearum]|uniref:DUF4062 domain-containing protein n=1 Tax=Pectobacterium aroidearum TaxID=1201031 RepID=UPI002A811386|nr:DUF4062 domain-containing protein [Pectobacterium aroidearum]MDY4388360.1 DUF4062 domain-containing protein [Pectobacterium aroidearum]